MTGPPTPPPSSATEIEDAARTAVPPPQVVPATEVPVIATPVPPQPTVEQSQPTIASQSINKTAYELLFPSIVELAKGGQIKDLIQVAERGDLSADPDRDPARVYIVAPLVLSYLIVDEIPNARHVVTRLPENLTALPLIQALFKLVASVSERKYSNIYSRAQQIHQFVLDPAFPDAMLGQLLASLMTGFVDAYRKRTFALLARAYTSIPLALAQRYLGLTSEAVVDVAVPAGWSFHETTYILTPPKQKPATSRLQVNANPSTLMALTLVADSVANLES